VGAILTGVKRPGREGEHSPPAITEIEDCMELYLHCPIHLDSMVLNLAEGRLYIGCLCEVFAEPYSFVFWWLYLART
jgi:hypothetical protein